jgi:hypothetical protein
VSQNPNGGVLENREQNFKGVTSMRIILAVLFFSLWLIPSHLYAQKIDAQQRTEEIVSSLNKSRYQLKEKRGVRKEKYRSVRSEPTTKKNIADYSGQYEVPGLGYNLEIKVTNGGNIEAIGYEPKNGDAQQGRKFTFRNAKIEGALLTATKVYDDGSKEKFEGVFIDQMNIEGVSPQQIERRDTTFGLAVVDVRVKTASGVNLDRLFYQRR